MLRKPAFIGVSNYIYIFTKDPVFLKSLTITVIYTFVSVPLKLCFALIIALLLNQQLKRIGVFRTVYYLPSIIGSSVAMAAAWRGLFAYDGAVNSILKGMGMTSVEWFTSPIPANSVIILLSVWQFGSSMVIFLAGLKGIPYELYEASHMDGATKLMSFWRITIPQLTPVIFFNMIMQMINALQEFAAPLLITQNGGPMKSTYLYGLKLYEEGFRYNKMGYASALSWILFVIILVLTCLAFKHSGWVHYEDGEKA